MDQKNKEEKLHFDKLFEAYIDEHIDEISNKVLGKLGSKMKEHSLKEGSEFIPSW